MADSAEPNLILPLAVSYNTRGIAGFTNTVTDGIDQRKINVIYEPVQNPFTEKLTLYPCKRPGVVSAGATYGISTQAAYLVHHAPTIFGSSTNNFVFSTVGNDTRVSSSTTTTTVTSAVGAHPAYVDRTAISNVDNIVFQVRTPSSGAQTAWYMTSIGAATQISDADFTGLTLRGKMEFLDGFAFAADNVAKAVYNSDVNSLSAWGASSYISKQIVQDEVQGLARLGKQIICFGSETAEVFHNIGVSEGSPLATLPQLFFRVGLPEQVVAGYTHYYATLNNRIYFVGRESPFASLGLYMYDTARFEKVSPQAMDKVLTERAGSIYSVNRVFFSGKEAVAIALDATTAATQRWLVFFPEWKDFVEWQSTIFTPVNNGEWFLGVSPNQNLLMRLSQTATNYQDNGTNYTWTLQFRLPSRGNHWKRMPMFGVVGDTARSTSSLNVEFSDDDWQTYSVSRAIDMTSENKAIYRCGAYRNRAVRLTHTANLDVRIESAVARVE